MTNTLWVPLLFCTEKAMAPHSSSLAWKIPWMEEPARLQSMGSLRVGHHWATSLALFTFMHWRRKWQPTPVFLPGESQGWRSLMGCHLWGRAESDTTKGLGSSSSSCCSANTNTDVKWRRKNRHLDIYGNILLVLLNLFSTQIGYDFHFRALKC